MNATSKGVRKKYDFTLGIDQDIVFDAMLLLFTAVIGLLCLSVFRTLNRTFYTIMKKNGSKSVRQPKVAKIHHKRKVHLRAQEVLQGLPTPH